MGENAIDVAEFTVSALTQKEIVNALLNFTSNSKPSPRVVPSPKNSYAFPFFPTV